MYFVSYTENAQPVYAHVVENFLQYLQTAGEGAKQHKFFSEGGSTEYIVVNNPYLF